MDCNKIRISINKLIDNKKYCILYNINPTITRLEEFNRTSILKKFSYNPSINPVLYMTDICGIKYFIIKENHSHRYFSFSIDKTIIKNLLLIPQIFYNVELKYIQ